MKTIHIFETAEELVKAFKQHRTTGDESPWLGNPNDEHRIIVDTDGTMMLHGKAADAYRIDHHILYEDVVQVLLQNARLPVEQLAEKEDEEWDCRGTKEEEWDCRGTKEEDFQEAVNLAYVDKQGNELHVTEDKGMTWQIIDISKFMEHEYLKGRFEVLKWVKEEINKAADVVGANPENPCYYYQLAMQDIVSNINDKLQNYVNIYGFQDDEKA